MTVRMSVHPAEPGWSTEHNSCRKQAQNDEMSQKTIIREQYTEVTLFRSLKPLILIAKMFGLCFVKTYPGDEALEDSPKMSWSEVHCPEYRRKMKDAKEKISVTPSQVYCAIVVVLLYVNTARLFAAIDPKNGFGPVLFGQIVIIFWNLLCSVNATAMYAGWLRKDVLPKFFLLWQELHPQQQEASIVCRNNFKDRVSIYVGITITCILLNYGFCIYAAWMTPVMETFLAPLTLQDGSWSRVLLLVYALTFQLWVTAAWTIPTALAFFICVGCRTEFQKFNYEMRNELSPDGKFNGDLEFYRRRHQKICHLVEHADGFFSIQAAGVCAINTGILLLLLYNIAAYDEVLNDPLTLMMNMFWITTGIISITITCVGGAIVNHEAHASVDTLYDMALDSTMEPQTTQITMFLHRLNGAPIGLTGLKLFVIDKPMILTLLGVMITYFVLIVQFAPISESVAGNGCNCSYINLTCSKG